LSARAKWIASAAAFAAGGLIASIPAFLGKSALVAHRAPRYDWIASLPVTPEGVSPVDRGGVIASTSDGQQLHASRYEHGVCFLLGRSGGGCESLDRKRQIQLVGRVRDGKTAWWGILGGDARAVRVRFADGSARESPARRGFGFLGRSVVSFTALNEAGEELGSVPADSFVPIECRPESCSITFSAEG
jgi:hypothetical protein